MAEYIEREALKNDIANSTEPFNTGSVFRAINRQPAADVALVVHARWIDAREYCGDYMCSNCEALYGTNKFNYCPNCGAEMDGGAD